MAITRRPLMLTIAASFALLAQSCLSSSIGSDVDRVKQLSRAEHLAELEEGDIDPAPHQSVKELLRRPLSVQSASKIALLNNRELRARLRMLGVTRGRLKQAALLPNPQAEVEILPEQDSDLELRLEYGITEAILAPLRSRAFEPELDAARYQTAALVVELGYRVRAQYIRVQAAEQKLAVAKTLLLAYAAGRDAAVALRESGGVRELDEAQHVVALEKGRIRIAELELSLMTEREALHRLLGVHGAATGWGINTPLAAVPAHLKEVEQLETTAVRSSLALKEQRHRIESLARRAGFADASGWIPDVDVDVHALRSDGESATPRDEWRWGAGVSFSVPLFDRNQGDAVALQAQGDALLERYYGLSVDLRSHARQLAANLASAHARALHYHTVIAPAQKRLAEQILLQYNAMQVGIFELLRAKREQLEVELGGIDAAAQFWIVSAAYDALQKGVLVSDNALQMQASVQPQTDTNTLGGH